MPKVSPGKQFHCLLMVRWGDLNWAGEEPPPASPLLPSRPLPSCWRRKRKDKWIPLGSSEGDPSCLLIEFVLGMGGRAWVSCSTPWSLNPFQLRFDPLLHVYGGASLSVPCVVVKTVEPPGFFFGGGGIASITSSLPSRVLPPVFTPFLPSMCMSMFLRLWGAS